VNRAPVATDDAAETDEGNPVDVNVLANDADPDGDPLTVADYAARSVNGGTVSCTAAGVCTFTPVTNFKGVDSFTYTISDGKGGSDTATVVVTVRPVKEPEIDVRLSELLPVPATVDWNEDGIVDDWDEWIELFNAGADAVDLAGWTLDNGGQNGAVFAVPTGTVLRPGGILLLYRRQTGIPLGDEGGQVRLLNPSGAQVDAVTFGALGPDTSYSRDIDGTWRVDPVPSPGVPNLAPETGGRNAGQPGGKIDRDL
jgi:hypothetical protein